MDALAELLATRPSGAWPLWEGTTTFIDYSGNSNHANSATGVTPAVDVVCPAIGRTAKIASGANFIDLPAAAVNSGTGQPMTMAVWARNYSAGGTSWMFGKSTSASRYAAYYVDASSAINYATDNGQDEYVEYGNGHLPTSLPYRHLAITIDATDTLRAYSNGQTKLFDYQVGPTYATLSSLSSKILAQRHNGGNLRIGANSAGSGPTMGYALAAVWQRVLSAGEIYHLYRTGLGQDLGSSRGQSKGRLR